LCNSEATPQLTHLLRACEISWLSQKKRKAAFCNAIIRFGRQYNISEDQVAIVQRRSDVLQLHQKPLTNYEPLIGSSHDLSKRLSRKE
jgi:hypothetical protein